MVHQHVTHGERGGIEEMQIVAPTMSAAELEIRFVDEGRGLQGGTRSHLAPNTPGDSAQLIIKERHELIGERPHGHRIAARDGARGTHIRY